MLTTATTLYVKYGQVDQLQPSSPVFIRGLQVGMVKDLEIDPADDRTIIATLEIETDADIPKDAIAMIVGQSIMGGKAINLVFNHACDGDGCVESGDTLRGGMRSFVQSVLGEPEALDPYLDKLKSASAINIDSLAKANPQGWAGSVMALDHSLRHLETMTLRINQLLAASTNGIVNTANNTAEITRSFRESNKDISATIANLATLSEQLKNAGLDKSAQKATQAIDSVTANLVALRGTLQNADKALSRVDTLAQGLVRGKGLAGKVLTEEELYNNLISTTHHLHLLLQDLRLNPRRYTTLKVKLFGKNKSPEYNLPIDDPAYELLIDSLERDYLEKIKN
ncbi:MAG TPA: MlaD family protein [Saprospiraceae bacterium]|nr:MlaD family protein [Saprospiraceae bacterium]HND88659.1 MlaD family protein [Saprospiraceae bacterium]